MALGRRPGPRPRPLPRQVHTATMSTIDEALRTAIREAVAEGLREPLAQLRTALEAAARVTKWDAEARGDPELAEIRQLEYLTAEEAGKLLRIGRHTVYKLVNAGYLKCTRFGKKLIFSRAELDAFMAQHGHHAAEIMTADVRRRLARPA
jgi:excisionase family DNA binding protein